MKEFDTKKISMAIILFCRAVKFQESCTAKRINCNPRTASLLKNVLTHKFNTSSGAPFDFPRLFICDDKHKQLYHKCTTPNDVDLSDLKTIETIKSLMTYVGKEKTKKKDGTVVDVTDGFSLSLKDIKDIIIKKTSGKLTISVIFR